jgi:hypothetical protein
MPYAYAISETTNTRRDQCRHRPVLEVNEPEMTMGTTSDRDQALVGDALPAEAGMKAVVQRRYGPPEVLEYTDVGRPVVGDGDVLVGVRAASVHPGDYFVMTGVPSIVRLAFGLRRPRHPIPGRDVAGVVEAVGAASRTSNRVMRCSAGARPGRWRSTRACRRTSSCASPAG